MNHPTEKKIVSANIHITDACNYRCRFCFSRDLCHHGHMGAESWKPILTDMIVNRGIRKINFAGGEPFLHTDLMECVRHCKQLGATTSVITNGSLLEPDDMNAMSGVLDWIGFSIDSCFESTEVALGRHTDGIQHIRNIVRLSKAAHDAGVRVKLDIVVTGQSAKDDFWCIIDMIDPERVKFMQVTHVNGVNDDGFLETRIGDRMFDDVIDRHHDIVLRSGKHPVFERSDEIIDSYLMLDPLGRIRLGTENGYLYLGYEDYWNGDMKVNLDRYISRGALYEWNEPGRE